MAMTAQVKAELASIPVTKACCRKSEVSSMLRFAGGLHIVSGRIVVEAELDTGAAARRLRRDIAEIYGHNSDLVMVSGNGIRKGSRYVVRVVRDGEALARQTGLLDPRGRPVRAWPVPGEASVHAATIPRPATSATALRVEAPPAGLSVAETKPMVQLIRALDPSLTLLIIEHDMDVAFEVATEITVLHNGQVLAQGSGEEIKANSSVRDVYLGTVFS